MSKKPLDVVREEIQYDEMVQVNKTLKREKTEPATVLKCQVALSIAQYVESLVLDKGIKTLPDLLEELRSRAMKGATS